METHQQQQQEWRRRAGRRLAADTRSAILAADANGRLHPSAGGVPVNTGHTVSSSRKIVPKSATQSIHANAKPSAAPIPPSRWKELRQSVRVKATMETEERRTVNAKIADLCEEDREKVAKLIRRIVEIGTLREEAEAEFSRQRGLYDAEIGELREQVKRDASELEDLSDKLKATLLKLRDYQERVLVLEESNDVEARRRLETDQTMDLLKMEVEKLRKLVREQKEEMDLKDQEEQSRFKQELERVQQQLRDAQEALLHEQRDRIQEKQRELDERMAKSMANSTSPAAASEKAHSQMLSSPSSSQVRRSEGAPTLSIPQLDMLSFLNTSVELPERIKDIMDEWKQRVEDAIAGTVRSIADQSRVVSSASQGIERSVGSHEDCKEEGNEGNVSSDDEGEDEPNSRTSRARQQDAHSTQRRTLQLRSVPKVNRRPFDKYLRIESEVGSEAEIVSQESPWGREVSSRAAFEEGEEEQVGRTRQKGKRERRDRTERAHRACARPHHRDHKPPALKLSGRESGLQKQHRHRRNRRDDDSYEEEGRFSVSHEAHHNFEQDEDGGAEEREERGHGGDSEVVLMNSVHSQPFVLINGDYQGGRRVGVNTNFGSLYETSLFDVVDAMEGAQAPIQVSPRHLDAAPSQAARSPQQHNEVHSRHFDPEVSNSSSVRLQSLLQGMQVRERKLARLDGHNDNLLNTRDDHQRTTSNGFDADDVDDFDIVNEVKDIYEEELFESRQQRGAYQSHHQLHGVSSPGFSGSGGSSLGPPLSPHDLSVREAIEKEMAELLREEAFQELLQ